MLAHVLSCALFVISPQAPQVSASAVNKLVDPPQPIPELVDELTHASRRREDPERAREVVLDLHGRFENAGPRDRRSISKGFENFLERCELVEPEWREVGLLTVTALGSMGDEGVDVLLDQIDDRRHESDLDLGRRLILTLGRTRHEDGIRPLSRLLNHAEPIVQGAAAEALGEFDKLDQRRRKDVFYALLKTLLDAREKVVRDPFDVVVRERYEVVVGPVTTSLQRLSGHDERDPEQWQRFWNKHKRDDWDEPMS